MKKRNLLILILCLILISIFAILIVMLNKQTKDGNEENKNSQVAQEELTSDKIVSEKLSEISKNFTNQEIDIALDMVNFYGYAAMLAYTENTEYSVYDIYEFYKSIGESDDIESLVKDNKKIMKYLGLESVEDLTGFNDNISEMKENIKTSFQNLYSQTKSFSMKIENTSNLEEVDDLYVMKINYTFSANVNGKTETYTKEDEAYFIKEDEEYILIFANFLSDINNAFEINTVTQQLTDLEITIHNAKFSSYEGKISGESVKTLLSQVLTSNKLYSANKDKLVTVMYKPSNSEDEKITPEKFSANEEDYVIWNNGYYIITPKVSDNASYSYVSGVSSNIDEKIYYSVSFDYDYWNAGYITTIIISNDVNI